MIKTDEFSLVMREKQSSRFTMRDILDRLDLGLKETKPGAGVYRGKCPIHGRNDDGNDTYMSFNLDVEKGYKCFSGHCGVSGGAISFVKDYFGLKNFLEAHKYINKHFNIKTEIYEQWEEQQIEPYMDYLKGRGLTRETIRHYGLSVSLDKRRIKIPVSYEGETVGAIFRGKNDEEPRYFCEKDFRKSQYLFNHDNVVGKESSALLVEGAFSVFKIWQYTGRESLATLSCNVSNRQMELLEEIGMPVYIMFDGDEPGRKSAERIEERLKDRLETRIIMLNDGVQPDHLSKRKLKTIFGKYGI